MDFLGDSLKDEILLQTGDPPLNALVDVPITVPASEPPATAASTASGLKPVPSPTSSLPAGDLAIQSPQERGKGKLCAAHQLSQELVNPQITTHFAAYLASKEPTLNPSKKLNP